MNARKVLNSSILQSLSLLSGVVITFLLTPFMIKALGDHYYGIWVLTFTITSYFALSDLGMITAVQNHLAISLGRDDLNEFRRIFANAHFLYLLICLGMLVLVALASVIVFSMQSRFSEAALMAKMVVITGVTSAVSFFFYPYASVLTSHIRFDVTATVAMAQSL